MGNINILTGNINWLTGNINWLMGNINILTGNINILTGNINWLMDGCCLILIFTVIPLSFPAKFTSDVEASSFRSSLFLSTPVMCCFSIFGLEYAFS